MHDAIRPLPVCAGALLGLLGIAPAVTRAPLHAQSFTVTSHSPWAGYAMPNGQWLTGDFNFDGRADLVHAVANTDYVHTWMSTGTASFTVGTFRPWTGYAIPNGLWMTGDFNGDSKTDILHAVANTDYTHVWMSNGDGTFDVTSFSPWAGYSIPNGLWLPGDFNRDGRTDVLHAVANTDYTHLWTSNGDGTFAVSTFRPWAGYSIPNGIWRTGDFNADGRTDVLHAVENTDYVHVWMSTGTGTFTVGTFRPWSGYAIPNGLWLTGDYDGDGRTDILHAVANSDYAHVWTSDGAGGFTVGTFRPWAGYAIPNGEWLVGDYDRDGRSDVVHAVANTDYAHIWRSSGSQSFSVSTFSPWSGYAIPNGLWLPLDFSGDRRTDLVHVVANTNYVHPWQSLLPMPGDVALDGLEVTQAIQTISHSVPLVAGKESWARAYLSVGGTAPVTVRGTLAVRDLGTNATVTVAANAPVTLQPAQLGQLRPKREAIAASLNFRLPAGVSGAGQRRYTLQAVVNDGTGAALSCSNCAAGPVALETFATSPMRLRIVGLQYTTGTAPNTVNNPPRAVDFALLQSWLRRAYPIGQLIATQTVVNANSGTIPNCGQANTQVSAIRVADVAAGTDARTHYYALVHDAGGFMRGCAAGIPGNPDPSVVSSGPTGTPAGNFSWDTDASYGDWYGGHEIAHTLGRFHPGFCGASLDDMNYPWPNGQISDNDGAFVGFDVGDATNTIAAAALPGVQWFDVMTYCSNQWVSAYTYLGNRQRLNGENPAMTGVPVMASADGRGLAARAARRDTACECGPTVRPARAAPARIVTGRRAPPAPKYGVAARPAIPEPVMRRPDFEALRAIPAPPVPSPALQRPPEPWRPPIGLRAQRALAADLPRPQPPVMRTADFLSIIGLVNLTRGTAEIQYVTRVARVARGLMAPDGRARLRVLGVGDRVIAEYPVALRDNTDIPVNEDKTAVLDEVIPYDAAIRTIQLLLGDRVVATVRASATAPVLRTPRISELTVRDPNREGLAELRWEGQDADGDTLRYTVQISRDRGATWETIAVGLRENRITIYPMQLGDAALARVRVIASDGFRSSAPVELTYTRRR